MATHRYQVTSESGRVDGWGRYTRLAFLLLCTTLFLAACLVWNGCFQVVKRRPEADQPWWEDPGNRPEGEIVQGDTTGVADGSQAGGDDENTGAEDSPPTNLPAPEPAFASGMDAPVSTAKKPRGNGAPTRATGGSGISGGRVPELDRKLQLLHTERTRSQKETVERVNEYALWCIENGMWKEARLHLEKALAVDSVSASLSNNLGVVYERLGEREKAELAYQRARALNPRREAYRINLRQLQGRKSREVIRDGEELPDSLAAGLEDLGLDAPVESGDGPSGGSTPERQNPGSEPEGR